MDWTIADLLSGVTDLVTRRGSDSLRVRGPYITTPYIWGMEVTQSLQYYESERHLTDPADRGPDNSLRLAAKKPAWIRVYVRSPLIGDDQQVTGELVVERSTGAILKNWTPVTTRLPWPFASVTTQRDPAYAVERGNLSQSLNFNIGASDCWGILRLTARIWRVGDASRTIVGSYEETVDATMLQTLRLRGIFIAYDGPDPTVTPPLKNVKLAAPTVANLQSTAALTLTMFPLQAQAVFSSGGNMNWFVPLTSAATEAGGCSSEWIGLNYFVSLMKQNDGNRSDCIYYGLLPSATPIALVGGCETYGVSTGPDTIGSTMAHEVGHAAGLKHGPCGTTGDKVDPDYPSYEPYEATNTPTADIGEYGLDIRGGTIHPPTDKDFMSYCPASIWISIYHYRRLCWNNKFDPQSIGNYRYRPPDLVDPYLWPWEYIPDPPNWQPRPGDMRLRPENLISILGVTNMDGTPEVRNVTRITALRDQTAARSTPWTAELLGVNGEVASRAPVMRPVSNGCGCSKCKDCEDESPSFVFQAMMTDAEPGQEIRIVERSRENPSDQKVVWSRTAPARKPRVTRFVVKVEEKRLIASWEGTCAKENTLEFSLQFSKDRGRSWNGLTVGIKDNRYTCDAADVPSGNLIFRVLAHDGFYTATEVSKPVQVPARPPLASILSPRTGAEFLAGMPLQLWGAGISSDGLPVATDAATWLIDGHRVATGLDAFVIAPAPGNHRCTLSLNGPGGSARATAEFRTIDPAIRENNPIIDLNSNAALTRRKIKNPTRRKRS
jgi:hypothetical protein